MIRSTRWPDRSRPVKCAIIVAVTAAATSATVTIAFGG